MKDRAHKRASPGLPARAARNEFFHERRSPVRTSQGIDTSNDNPARRLQLGVLMAVAEFESEIIGERVNTGLRVARVRGARLRRPATNGVHADAIRRLRAEGKGLQAISQELGISIASVHKIARQGKEDLDGNAWVMEVVAGDGIEPPTQGFSVLCSTD